MDTREQFAQIRRNLIDRRSRRLIDAAGGTADDGARRAFAELAGSCGPDTVNALVALLTRLSSVAPHRRLPGGRLPPLRRGAWDAPLRGVAITADGGGRYGLISRVVQAMPAKYTRGKHLARVRAQLHATYSNVLDTLHPGRGRITATNPLGLWDPHP
jgi:hypothetical protein